MPPDSSGHPVPSLRLSGAAAWLAVALVKGVHQYFFGQSTYRVPAELWPILVFDVPLWLLWWPAHYGIRRLGRRWPFTQQSVMRPLLVHLGASLSLAAVLLLLHAAWALYAFPYSVRPDATFGDAVVFFTKDVLIPVNLGLYWLLLLVDQARSSLRELRRRDRREAQLEAQVAEARLAALKMQLQPHFLFNALNATVSLIHRNESAKAVDMLHQIAAFLRLTLEDGGELEVPLRRELAFADHYLRIEQTRPRCNSL